MNLAKAPEAKFTGFKHIKHANATPIENLAQLFEFLGLSPGMIRNQQLITKGGPCTPREFEDRFKNYLQDL